MKLGVGEGFFAKDFLPIKYLPGFYILTCKGPTGKSPGVPPRHNAPIVNTIQPNLK